MNVQVCMFSQGPHLAKHASKEISFCHTVACNFLHHWQVSLCLYKNVVNEIKPSQLKNCPVLVDMKNTIGCH